jgi:hypothetical protein
MNENGNQTTSINTADNSTGWVRRIILAAMAILFGLVVLLLVSFLTEWLGVRAERNDVVALGQIGKSFFFLTILVLNSIIPFIFKILSLGKYDIGNYFSKVRYIFLFNIVIVLIYYFSPIPVTPSTMKAIALISLVISVLSLATSQAAGWIGTGVLVIVCLVYFPRVGQIVENRVRQLNQPKLLRIEPGHIAAGKTRLFLDGKPIVFYLYRQDTNTYELFDSPGMHDIFPQQLQPVTEEMVRSLVENEELLSPRNLDESKDSRAAAKGNDDVSETRHRLRKSRERELQASQPRLLAVGKKRVLTDTDRQEEENFQPPTDKQAEPVVTLTPANRIDAPGKMLLTVDNANCRQLNIYAGGRFIATVAANTRRLIHLERGSFTTKICVWGEMGCGQESHYHWTGDAFTIPVSRNPNCDSQFGVSTYSDIKM